MTDAALLLGITGTSLSLVSLAWNVVQYRLNGARPKLTPIVGVAGSGDGLMIEAVGDVWPTLLALESQLDTDPADRVVGVTVINKGRAALHVTDWEICVLPLGARQLIAPVHGSSTVPCTIPPGGKETFFTSAATTQVAAAAARARDGRPQHVVAKITTGGHTHTSKPIPLPPLPDGTR